MPSDSYVFAVGRIRGLERGYVDEADFQRLSELPLQGAVKALADSGYGKNAADKDDPDALIDAEMEQLRDTVEELTPGETGVFWLEQDAVNLKLLLKARLLEHDVDDRELAAGLFAKETLRTAVRERVYSALPEDLAGRMAEVERLIDRESVGGIDPLTLSAEVDKAVYAYILGRLGHRKNAFIKDYFQARIDFTNLLSMLRARLLRWDRKRFAEVFVEGGDTPKSSLLSAYDLPGDAIGQTVSLGVRSGEMTRAIEAFAGDDSISAASAVLDGALSKIASGQKTDSFGIGPIVHYLLKKTAEGRRLRVLFAKKRAAGLSRSSREGE